MPIKSKLSAGFIAGGLLMAATVAAHHSFTQFDQETELVTTGTVVRWEFNNPHSWLRVNIPDSDGNNALWSFEGSGPTSLIGRGITGASFEPGDTITLMFCPMVDGRNGGHMGWAELADGSVVNPSDGGCNGNEANIQKWRAWREQGFKSNKDAMAAEGN